MFVPPPPQRPKQSVLSLYLPENYFPALVQHRLVLSDVFRQRWSVWYPILMNGPPQFTLVPAHTGVRGKPMRTGWKRTTISVDSATAGYVSMVEMKWPTFDRSMWLAHVLSEVCQSFPPLAR